MELFISYTHKDDVYREKLMQYIDPLSVRHGIRTWHDRQLMGGDPYEKEIESHLESASIVLLLVTQAYLASDSCKKEFKYAIGNNKTKVVVPIILESSTWKDSEFNHLQVLPKDGKPIKIWDVEEEAWMDVYHGLDKIIKNFTSVNVQRVANEFDGVNIQMNSNKKCNNEVSDFDEVFPISIEIDEENDKQEMGEAVNNVFKLLGEYIPDFEAIRRDMKDNVTTEIREKNIFKYYQKRVFLLGRSNAGKTSIINLMLKKDVFPASQELTCTKTIACGSHEHGLIFYDSPGIGDEARQENITRAALNLEQQLKDKIDKITLIDISSQQSEGPENTNKIEEDVWSGEINQAFYAENIDKIKIKEFSLSDFSEWSKNKFDFIIFVMNSEHGLFAPDAELLADLYKSIDGKNNIFRILNVWSNSEEKSVAINKRYNPVTINQANERLKKKGIAIENEWIVVDAKNNIGFDKLMAEFARRLPIETLKQFDIILKKDYSDIIKDKIDSIYFDCLARIACLVGVFKVNYKINEGGQKENFLSFAIESLIILSEYIFETHGGKIPIKPVKELIEQLRWDRYTYRTVEKKITVPEKREIKRNKKAGEFFLDIFDKGEFGLTKADTVTLNIDKTVKKEKWYYKKGGMKAIELTLAVGKALYNLHNGEGHKMVTEEQFKDEIEQQLIKLPNRETIKKEILCVENYSIDKKIDKAHVIFDLVRCNLKK